ncbi:MAG: VWA domain-containing protein [Acidobacteria bacterium]|nr:VWA domain-containing protein [Acidobacteriota bacterium]MYG76716.1 VWA domain-containing protein [Acidobacteriota bacterium]
MFRNPAQMLRGKRLACGLIVLATVFAATVVAGQTFRFRAAATRVIVDVLVLDGDGNPVPGLSPGDFELFEDGEEQRVASLDVVDWERYELGEAVPDDVPPLAPELEAADAGNASPRRFVIVFNRRGADPVNLRRAKRGLEEFVSQHMVDGDETMILEFAHTVRVLQEFYSGKEATLANVRRIVPGTYQSPVGPEIDARDSFRMLFALAEALERVEGRKIVVFLSMDLQTFADPRQVVGEIAGTEVDEFPGRRALDETNSLRDAILQLNHANATLYAVNLAGVYGFENNILNPALNAFDVMGNPLPVEPDDHPLTRMDAAANVPMEGGTASLAVATGGTYFPNQTNFAVALNRIGIQNQLYYLLSFSPTKTELDGEYRQIEVRVRDRPDLRVIARPGYFARRRGDVIEAAARGDYDYAFPEDLNTYAYLLNPTPHGAFGVLAAALPESYLEEPAEVRLRVVGPGGAVLSEAAGPVDIRRFWVSTPAELPSGEHRLELVVERGGERVHAGSSALTIPAGFGETFSLSSVFPFVAEEHAPQAVGPPVRPVAAFAQAEDARVAFFIFPGHEDPVSQVRVAYEIRNAIGDIAVEAERPGRFDLDPRRLEGTPIMLSLQTGPLRAGRYTVVVRVSDDSRNRSAVGELPFLIR